MQKAMAHEIGHNLGAYHDESMNITSCTNRKFLMSDKADPKNPETKMSPCTKKSIVKNLRVVRKDRRLNCLKSQPMKTKLIFKIELHNQGYLITAICCSCAILLVLIITLGYDWKNKRKCFPCFRKDETYRFIWDK